MVSATFLPLLGYGDLLYMNAPGYYLKKLDSGFHSALRFITSCSYQTHHCILYEKTESSSLYTQGSFNWYCFIYKSICDLTPSYLSLRFSKSKACYNLRSKYQLYFKVPRLRTDLWKKGFRYIASLAWNNLQSILKLTVLPSLHDFKLLLTSCVFYPLVNCSCDIRFCVMM